MNRETVAVEVTGAPYDVIIGPGALRDVGVLLRDVSDARRIALVTDTTVADLHGAEVAALCASKGFDVFPLTIEPGETSKNWTTAGDLLEALAGAGLDRSDLVIALGGGVIGDIAGFTAATYLRGVQFAQIPTTLLAQVDSSVGGKTGVDLRAGKNLAGAFKQPAVVVADTRTLLSLPESEWANGLAEVAKSSVIDGEGFLSWLEVNTDDLVARGERVTVDTVKRCVEFKSEVVGSDEREEGVRECLNYGHTLAHAIENRAGYGVVPHGVAVAEGMRFAVRISVEVAGASRDLVARQDRLLDRLGLPAMRSSFDPRDLLSSMHSDKKARGGSVRFVLVDGPGSWRCEAVPDATILEHLEAWAASKERD